MRPAERWAEVRKTRPETVRLSSCASGAGSPAQTKSHFDGPRLAQLLQLSGTTMKLTIDASTHVGQREGNEDALISVEEAGLFVVADGMGGYEGGALASQLVVSTIANCLAPNGTPRRLSLHEMEQEVRQSIRFANRAVAARRYGPNSQMGATMAGILLHRGHGVIAHVGDSRVYRLRQRELEQLTEDHSLYAMLQAAGIGELPPPDEFAHRSVVTRAVGTSRCEPDTQVVALRTGDVFLLCSDGLSDVLTDTMIQSILVNSTADVAARALVSEAYVAGGDDNITALVVTVEDSGAPCNDRHTQRIVR